MINFIVNLKSIYRFIFPRHFRSVARIFFKYVLYNYRFLKLRLALISNKPVKLVLGAALTSQPGWFSTNEQWLDISKESDWYRLFRNKPCISNAVAEHVFEHLTVIEMRESFRLLYKYLIHEIPQIKVII